MPRAARAAVRMALRVAVAAALTIGTVPARSDAPSANTLGNSVLPALPEPPNGTATPELGPAAPALSGASASPPVNAPAPTISEAPSGAPEAAAEPLSAAEQLAAARREAIAAASRTQECERTLVAIEHEIALLASDADARRRSLAESRAEQARLLGAILHRVRNARRTTPTLPMHCWSSGCAAEALMRDADPALRAQLRALTGEIAAARCASEADRRQEKRGSGSAAGARDSTRAPRSRGGAPQRRTAGNVAAAEHRRCVAHRRYGTRGEKSRRSDQTRRSCGRKQR